MDPGQKKRPKVNCRLKEVKEMLVSTHHTFTTTYFDNMWDNMRVQGVGVSRGYTDYHHEPVCMCHLYRLRINTHVVTLYHALHYRTTQGTQGKKMTQSKSQIKGSKGSVGGYPPHIYHHIF